MFLLAGLCAGAQKKPAHLDASQPMEIRIDDLLGRLTLTEKLGQIDMPCVCVSG